MANISNTLFLPTPIPVFQITKFLKVKLIRNSIGKILTEFRCFKNIISTLNSHYWLSVKLVQFEFRVF